VECCDGSFYTGIATDVARRLAEHERGAKGAKYLRGRGPLKLVYEHAIGDRSLASRVEARIKRLPRTDKADLAGMPARIEAMLADLAATGLADAPPPESSTTV